MLEVTFDSSSSSGGGGGGSLPVAVRLQVRDGSTGGVRLESILHSHQCNPLFMG